MRVFYTMTNNIPIFRNNIIIKGTIYCYTKRIFIVLRQLHIFQLHINSIRNNERKERNIFNLNFKKINFMFQKIFTESENVKLSMKSMV